MPNPFEGAIASIQTRFNTLGGSSPFSGQSLAGTGSPFNPGLGGSSPFTGGTFSGRSPFQGAGFNVQSPFSGGFNAMSPFRGGAFGVGSPFGGSPFSGMPRFNPYTKAEDTTPGSGSGDVYFGGDGATGADAGTDKWRGLIDEAARANGIDGDVVQAVMMIESGGRADATSSAGALGLMQVMPFHFGPGENGMDPRTNVQKGAKILADNYKQYGSWDKAVAAYLGAIDANGNITHDTDANGTDGFKYAEMFNANLQAIKAARQKMPAAAGGQTPARMASIWGGFNAPIMQEFGDTDYSRAHPYNYGGDFGMGTGHHGLDIALARGTQLKSPVTGTVIIAGGSGYYKDNVANPGSSGEIRIRLANGHEVILGHASQVNVRVGQQVKAGDLLGLSGGADGDHLHLEYRIPANTNTGQRAVDPRQYLK
jgi:murein DD-endopeptidase MepM/ murein hydrolase activator NlpD